MKKVRTLWMMALILVFGCKTKISVAVEEPDKEIKKVTARVYGAMPDGREVKAYTLTNAGGLTLEVINYGGIITSLRVPDKEGTLADVVLGYDSLQWYMKSNPYFGALIGRYGNRIAQGKFAIDQQSYSLPVNDNVNHLHGGPAGFDKVFWNIDLLPDSASLRLTYTSVDGEQGYPGKLETEVIYTLTDNNELKINYLAISDKKTIINLTQHSYFNLTGNPNQDILQHQLFIDANHYLPVDRGLIPTGKLQPVINTPFDFTKLKTIGDRIQADDEQLKLGKGYDHCWVLSENQQKILRKVGELYEPVSGRVMEVSTTEPGIQFYSGNFLDGTLKGKAGVVYQYRSGLCLETQHYPDSPNRREFPSVLLSPGETYQSTTVYKFSAR